MNQSVTENSWRALLVEDNESDAVFIRRMLGVAGGESCSVVDSVADCLKHVAENRPDVILLDLTLPDSEGLETVSRVLVEAGDVPVIVLTGHEDEELAVDAVHTGAQDFLIKGQVDAELLRRSIRYAIERKRFELERQHANAKNVELFESLQQSEQRFRQLAENFDGCVWMMSVDDWSMLYVSPAFERIWGRSCESLYENPESWLLAIHEDDRERVGNAFYNHVTSGTFDEEYRVVRPDKTIRFVWDRGVPICDEEGNVRQVAGIAHDITRRRILEQQLLKISTREQHRIAQELHDGLGQELTGLNYLAKSLANKLAESSSGDAKSAADLADGIRRAIGGVRTAIRGLIPVELDSEGLVPALSHLAENASESSDVKCRFRCNEAINIDDQNVSHHLYRVAQEATNNALKHADARHVSISLDSAEGILTLKISDDGQGMSNGPEANGLGLPIMQYRCSAIGAVLDIQSTNDSGTTITCSLRKDDDSPHRVSPESAK